MTYEEGYGATQADAYWFYSWATRAISARDTELRGRALRQALRVRDTIFYTKRLPRDRAYFDLELVRAAQGDMTLLRQDVAANAPQRLGAL